MKGEEWVDTLCWTRGTNTKHSKEQCLSFREEQWSKNQKWLKTYSEEEVIIQEYLNSKVIVPPESNDGNHYKLVEILRRTKATDNKFSKEGGRSCPAEQEEQNKKETKSYAERKLLISTTSFRLLMVF